jgi:hypothetical protein
VTTKLRALFGLTGLALAYVGHGLDTNWAPWTLADLLFGWFMSAVSLMPFMIVALPTIEGCQEFFVGHKRESPDDGDLAYSILMTLLMAAAAVAIAHSAGISSATNR